MNVIVWNGLTTHDSIILKNVEPRWVECTVNGVRYSSHEPSQRRSLGLAEIQDRWGVPGWNHKDGPMAVLIGIHERCNGIKSLNERQLLCVDSIGGNFAF